MEVSPADHRQEFEPGRTHAMERQIERVVGVDVGEIAHIYEPADWLVSGVRGQFSLEG